MKEITQQNIFLKVIENLIRSNLYTFIFFRYLTNKLLTAFVYETDFKILKSLNKINYFNKNKKKNILDIGANDGISVKSIRNFVKDTVICSIEPNKSNFIKLQRLKKITNNLKIYNFAVSSKSSNNKILYQPYYKEFSLSPFDSLNLKDVYKSMNQSLFIKNLKKKINIKKTKVTIKKIDSLNLNPCFIKIDIQGHELDCILGSLKTIKKNLPIIMVEYDKKIIKSIYNVLKKINYKKFFFRSNKNMIVEHKNEDVFNIFFIHKTILNELNSELNVILNDNN